MSDVRARPQPLEVPHVQECGILGMQMFVQGNGPAVTALVVRGIVGRSTPKTCTRINKGIPQPTRALDLVIAHATWTLLRRGRSRSALTRRFTTSFTRLSVSPVMREHAHGDVRVQVRRLVRDGGHDFGDVSQHDRHSTRPSLSAHGPQPDPCMSMTRSVVGLILLVMGHTAVG